MRTTEEVVARISTRYDSTWRNQLLTPTAATYSFSLAPPSTSVIAQHPGDVDVWLKSWRTWRQQHPQAHLRAVHVRTPFGSQPIFSHLDIDSFDELAALLPDKSVHWRRARQRWDRLGASGDNAAVRPWLHQILDLSDPDFAILLAAADWFRGNPRSGHTIRRVPVPGMHTKWLARHRRLVIALLGSATPDPNACTDDDPYELPADELDALGLKPLPREVDILLLDEADQARLGGLRQLRAPVDEIAALPLCPHHILIVENKEAALPLRARAGVVVVHSLGNHLEVLSQILWTGSAEAWYWGDLDRWGFTLLSRARSFVPNVSSVLMNASAVAQHQDMSVTDDTTRVDPPKPTLTSDELAALALLTKGEGHLRIEQERIPLQSVESALSHQLHCD